MKADLLKKRLDKAKFWLNYNKNIPTDVFMNFSQAKKKSILKEIEKDRGNIAVYEYRLKRLGLL